MMSKITRIKPVDLHEKIKDFFLVLFYFEQVFEFFKQDYEFFILKLVNPALSTFFFQNFDSVLTLNYCSYFNATKLYL